MVRPKTYNPRWGTNLCRGRLCQRARPPDLVERLLPDLIVNSWGHLGQPYNAVCSCRGTGGPAFVDGYKVYVARFNGPSSGHQCRQRGDRSVSLHERWRVSSPRNSMGMLAASCRSAHRDSLCGCFPPRVHQNRLRRYHAADTCASTASSNSAR